FAAHVTRNLRGLRQRVKFSQRPGLAIIDQAREAQLEGRALDLRHRVFAVIGIETEIFDGGALRVRRHQSIAEQRRLHAVVPARDRVEGGLYRILVGDVAAGEQHERAEAKPLLEERAALDRAHHALPQHVLGIRKRAHAAFSCNVSSRCAGAWPVIMVGSVFGTMMTRVTWTNRNSTIAAMPRKWIRRAVSKPPNRNANS